MKYIKKLLVFLDQWGLIALIILTAVFFGLAAQATYAQSNDTGLKAFFEALMDALNASDDDLPFATKIFQALEKVVVAWATVKIYINTAGLELDNLIAKYFIKDHIVIVTGTKVDSGESTSQPVRAAHTNDKTALAVDLALALAKQLQKDQGSGVVLVAGNIDPITCQQLWDYGVILLSKPIAMAQIADATNLKRAKMLVAMRNEFGDNIALTRIANSLETEGEPIQCKCLIEPYKLRAEFKPSDYFNPQALPNIRVFSEAELIARQLVIKHPPDYGVSCQGEDVHILLFGFGAIGQSLLLHIARNGHYKDKVHPSVTIVDRKINTLWHEFLANYPTVPQWVKVVTKEQRIENISKLDLNNLTKGVKPFNIVYACTKDEISNLRIATLCTKEIAQVQKPMVIAIDPPGGAILAEFKQQENISIFECFSLVEKTGKNEHYQVADRLLEDMDDDLAKAFHLTYRKDEELAKIKDPTRNKPYDKPWEELPEDARDANRSIADHSLVKLRALNLELVQAPEALPFVPENEELELLAEMEHNRWWAERTLNGWSYDSKRDDDHKLHPNMVAYSELDEPTKAYDRSMVRTMFELMQKEDWRVVRAA